MPYVTESEPTLAARHHGAATADLEPIGSTAEFTADGLGPQSGGHDPRLVSVTGRCAPGTRSRTGRRCSLAMSGRGHDR